MTPSSRQQLRPFGDVALAGRLFVPLNQRPWEWRAKHLDDLFDDLVDTTDRRCHQGADGRWVVRQDEARIIPHFFGPLVLETDAVTRERAVVDGQQRCTATTVLVAAMRDAVEPFCGGPTATRPAARSLRQALTTWLMADSEGGGERSRLHLDPTIAEFFDRYVIQCIGDEERAAYLAELGSDPVTDAEDVRQALIRISCILRACEVAPAVQRLHRTLGLDELGSPPAPYSRALAHA